MHYKDLIQETLIEINRLFSIYEDFRYLSSPIRKKEYQNLLENLHVTIKQLDYSIEDIKKFITIHKI